MEKTIKNIDKTVAKKIATGINGLDEMLLGGIPAGNQILIAGGPGAGKTLLSLEILYHNAKNGIPSSFIAFEETSDQLIINFKNAFPEFKDIDDLIKNKMIIIASQGPSTRSTEEGSDTNLYVFGNIILDIENTILSNNSKLVVIDSVSLLKLTMRNKTDYRRAMVLLISNMRRLNTTTLLTLELPSSERKDLKFTSEFFIFDGVIILYQIGQEEKRLLSMEIIKMRGTNHSLVFSPYEITSNGFKVFTMGSEF